MQVLPGATSSCDAETAVVFARRRAVHRGYDWIARTVATRRALKVPARL